VVGGATKQHRETGGREAGAGALVLQPAAAASAALASSKLLYRSFISALFLRYLSFIAALSQLYRSFIAALSQFYIFVYF